MLQGCAVVTMIFSAAMAQAEGPPRGGLALWLDAADAEAIGLGDDGRVTLWRDKSEVGNDATPKDAPGPRPVDGGLNGRTVLRFPGDAGLMTTRPLADGRGGLTAFVIYQRGAAQASERVWQRLLSSWDPETENDTKAPSYLMGAPRTGEPLEPALAMDLRASVYRGEITIGCAATGGNRFMGDIGEVLIYDHAFLVHEQIQNVKGYLLAKWGIVEDTQSDWTLVGPLPATPERVSDDLPLSDQTNEGGWKRFEPMWDEFGGEALDESKWWDHNPNWYGRAPSRYVGENATVGDGKLNIVMSIDETLPREVLYKNSGTEYHTYAAGSVVSKTVTVYGYFEIKAKAMDSGASSAWWFSGRSTDADGGVYRSEIDVFEIGGKAPGFDNKYNMNLHVFQTPEAEDHWSRGGSWIGPFRFADDHHVFGLEWGPEYVKYYLDGVLVRSTENTHWHNPLKMLFDTETMPSWMGMPEDDDLPSTFSVEYVRAWKNEATDTAWEETYSLAGDPAAPTQITEYVRGLSERGK